MSHRTTRRRTGPASRSLVLVSLLLAAAVAAGMVALWPPQPGTAEFERIGGIREVYDARVVVAVTLDCPTSEGGDALRCQRVEFELLEGPDRGQTVSLEFPLTPNVPDLRAGDKVVLAHQEGSQGPLSYSLFDLQRKPPLFWLALLFAAAVILFGRVRGVAALVGLGATFAVLFQFVLPAILAGTAPLLVALVGGGAIAFVALYLSHGFGRMTTIALLGTVASLALTAALGGAFVDLARLTGFGTEEASLVAIGASQVDIRGLVLAGIVLGALGAIDDVTITQASAVWEVGAADPAMSTRDLYRAGIRIGRAHVASTVNTLVLAYAGASLPILLLFVLSQQSLATVAGGEVVATEIVRTLVGSLGLVASVPITTWLAARMVPRGDEADQVVREVSRAPHARGVIPELEDR